MIGGGGNRHGEVEGLQKTLWHRGASVPQRRCGGRRSDAEETCYFQQSAGGVNRDLNKRADESPSGRVNSLGSGEFGAYLRRDTQSMMPDVYRMLIIGLHVRKVKRWSGFRRSPAKKPSPAKGWLEGARMERQEKWRKGPAHPWWREEERGRKRPLTGYLRVDILASWAFVRTFAALRCPVRWSAVAWAMSQAIAWRSLWILEGEG